MRYIHDGQLRDPTVDPPVVFVFDEPVTDGRGRTDTAALMADLLTKVRRKDVSPVIDHARDDPTTWRWTDR